MIERRKQKRKEAAIAQYRQKAEEFASDGEISGVESFILEDIRKKLGLEDEEARAVRAKVLETQGKYQKDLDNYRQFFTSEVAKHGYPLSEKARAELRLLQNHCNLKDEDVKRLEDEVIAQQKVREQPESPPPQPVISKATQQEYLSNTVTVTEPKPEPTVRPNTSDDDLSSEKGIDYTQLQKLLNAGQWKEADRETLNVMLKVAGRVSEGWMNFESIENFPCTDLRTIDHLWVKSSKRRFGFSVQKKIWQEVNANYETFGVRVGWRVVETGLEERGWLLWKTKEIVHESRGISEREVIYDLKAPPGHLPLIWSRMAAVSLFLGDRGFSSLASRLVNCNIQ